MGYYTILHMKTSILFTILIALGFHQATGQHINPFLFQTLISPSPMYDVASGGSGELAFSVGNSGDDAIELVKGKELILEIDLVNVLPDQPDPLRSINGSFAPMFQWTYDSTRKRFRGLQKERISGAEQGGTGDIRVSVKVSRNSDGGGPKNGFTARILVPEYLTGINLTHDDEVSAFTWTSAKPRALPDFELIAVNRLLRGNVSLNDKVEKGSTYGRPEPKPDNPSTCLPEFTENGEFSFACPVPGEYVFQVELCEPSPSTRCQRVPLTISVIR